MFWQESDVYLVGRVFGLALIIGVLGQGGKECVSAQIANIKDRYINACNE